MLTCQRDQEHTALRGLLTEIHLIGVLSNATRGGGTRTCSSHNPKIAATTKKKKDSNQASSKPLLEVPVLGVMLLGPSGSLGGGGEKVQHHWQRHGSQVKDNQQTGLFSNRENFIYPPRTVDIVWSPLIGQARSGL